MNVSVEVLFLPVSQKQIIARAVALCRLLVDDRTGRLSLDPVAFASGTLEIFKLNKQNLALSLTRRCSESVDWVLALFIFRRGFFFAVADNKRKLIYPVLCRHGCYSTRCFFVCCVFHKNGNFIVFIWNWSWCFLWLFPVPLAYFLVAAGGGQGKNIVQRW